STASSPRSSRMGSCARRVAAGTRARRRSKPEELHQLELAHRRALLLELVDSDVDLALREILDAEALLDGVVTARASARQRADQTLLDPVLARGPYRHRAQAVRPQHPVLDVIDGRVRGARGARRAARLDDLR